MARLKVNRTPPKPRASQQPQPASESAGRLVRRKSSGKSALRRPHRLPRRRRGQRPSLAAQRGHRWSAQPPDTRDLKSRKIKELVRLAQEQGYLTYSDINDALPDGLIGPEELDEIYVKLRNLEVEIVDQAEVDRIKQPEPEEEDEKVRLDILDDPVRMYLKQMGQVPLLTREQEVEISKRIEAAENEVKLVIYSFGFAGQRAHCAGGEAGFRAAQRAVRPRHCRQESREPREASQSAPQADRRGPRRPIKRSMRPTPTGRTARPRPNANRLHARFREARPPAPEDASPSSSTSKR